jgi:hypothetical protein
VQRARPGAVGVPQSLDGLRPLRDLVNFVDHQGAALRQPFRIEPCSLPVAHQPARVSLLPTADRDVIRLCLQEADSGGIGIVYCEIVVGRA